MEPGWFDDPDPRSLGMQERWWTGTQWADDVRPKAGMAKVSHDRAWIILACIAVAAGAVWLVLNAGSL